MEEKATLRILLYLAYSQGSDDRGKMIEDLRQRGVGRTAFYSSLKTLVDLDLLEDRRVSVGNRRFVETCLTQKGSDVVKSLVDLSRFLRDELDT
ncbi:hypothetical protein ES703_107681 [subsurface metagenome]